MPNFTRLARCSAAVVLSSFALVVAPISSAAAATPTPPPSTWPGRIVDSTEVPTIVSMIPASKFAVTVTVTATSPIPPSTAPPSTAPPSTAPPSTAPPSTAPPSTRSAANPSSVSAEAPPADPSSADSWTKLRKCESGGRYDLNSGNGYYGAYQFSAKTWTKLGYPGLPNEAQPEVQDEAARKLQAKLGWGQWPACSRRAGLR